MTLRLCLALMLMLLPLGAIGQERVVAALSRQDVAITTNFQGTRLFVFGAIKRAAPAPEGPPLEVIVTVAAPREPVEVRRKSRRAGIWVNAEAVTVDAAPGFYAVATTGPLFDVLTYTEDLRHDISVGRMIRSVGAPMGITDSQAFTEALIRIREDAGHYKLRPGAVRLREASLFDAEITLPADVTEGEYTARIFLTRAGEVIDSTERRIDVRMVGLERWVFNLSRERPLLYGLMAVALAGAAGWAAAAYSAWRRG